MGNSEEHVRCRPFSMRVGRRCGEPRKASADPRGVDCINDNSESTGFRVIASLFGSQGAHNPVPVQTCSACVNAFPNQSLSAQPCFPLIDVGSMVQDFKGLAKYKLCFQFPSFPAFGMPMLICSHAGAGLPTAAFYKGLRSEGFQPSPMLGAARPSFLTLCS